MDKGVVKIGNMLKVDNKAAVCLKRIVIKVYPSHPDSMIQDGSDFV